MSEIEVGSRVRNTYGHVGVVRYIDTDSGGRPTGAVKWDEGVFDVDLLLNLTLVPSDGSSTRRLPVAPVARTFSFVELPRADVEAMANWQPECLGKYWNSVIAASIKALDEQ